MLNDLPEELLEIIIKNLNNNKDIYNIRLTNKLCYNLLKDIPYYRNNIHIYDIKFKENNIYWYNIITHNNDKIIIFKPYGGVYIYNYNHNMKNYIFNTRKIQTYKTEFINKNQINNRCIIN